MAVKKVEAAGTTDIKRLLDAGKLVIGTERTLKNVKSGRAKKVFLSKNCDTVTCADIKRYAQLGGFDVVELGMTADELGAVCRKSFGISVLSVAKE